jgi:hypothetical protein
MDAGGTMALLTRREILKLLGHMSVMVPAGLGLPAIWAEAAAANRLVRFSVNGRPVEHRPRRYPLARAWVDEERFNHQWAGFDLGRYHKELKCSKCHLETRPYRDVARTCDGCHADFAPGVWKHDQAGCKLDSLHSGLACAECHTESWGEGKTPSCIRCHPQADYRPRQACLSDQSA